MFQFKIWLLYNEGKCFCIKTELLNFNIALALVNLDTVGSRLVPNGSVFLGDKINSA